jgi:hypothetical protein
MALMNKISDSEIVDEGARKKTLGTMTFVLFKNFRRAYSSVTDRLCGSFCFGSIRKTNSYSPLKSAPSKSNLHNQFSWREPPGNSVISTNSIELDFV